MRHTAIKLAALVAPVLLALVMSLAGCGDHHHHGDRGYVGDRGPVYREDSDRDRHEDRRDGDRHEEERHDEHHDEHH